MAPYRRKQSNEWSASKVFIPDHLSAWPDIKVRPELNLQNSSSATTKKPLKRDLDGECFEGFDVESKHPGLVAIKRGKIRSDTLAPKGKCLGSSSEFSDKENNSFGKGTSRADSSSSSTGLKARRSPSRPKLSPERTADDISPTPATPAPSALSRSSKEKLKDAVSRRERVSPNKASTANNIFNARPIVKPVACQKSSKVGGAKNLPKSSVTEETRNRTANALEVAAQNVQRLHLVPSSQRTPIPARQRNPKRHSTDAESVSNPLRLQTSGVTKSNFTTRCRMNQDQRAAYDRIASAYGEEFAERHLRTESIRTFSSNIDAGCSEPEIDPLLQSQNKPCSGDPLGWDIVLAEARRQAERLQARGEGIGKPASPILDSANQGINSASDEYSTAISETGMEDSSKNNSPGRKKRKNDTVAETEVDLDSEKPKPRKKSKTSENCRTEQNHHQLQERNVQRSNCEDQDVSATTPSEYLQLWKTEEIESETKAQRRVSLLLSLRSLIPEGILQTSLQSLNKAEYERISSIIKRERKAERKRIKKHKGDVKQRPVWSDVDPDLAMEEGLVEGSILYHRHDPEVVLEAAAVLIRTLSATNVTASATKAIK